MRSLAIVLLALVSIPALAQKEKREPLTEAQIEDIREAGVDPNLRIALYTKYANEHADVIKGLINRGKSRDRVKRIDDELQDFTALMDEMASNLDQYSDRHSDIRKPLKALTEATPRWMSILRAVPGEPGFDLSRKEAIESGDELSEQVKRLLSEQDAYFLAHKEEKGQERNDDQQPTPKPPSN